MNVRQFCFSLVQSLNRGNESRNYFATKIYFSHSGNRRSILKRLLFNILSGHYLIYFQQEQCKMYFSCFQGVKLPAEYKKGRLLAYRLLCMSMLRRPDLEIPMQQLTRFYKVLHRGLTHADQVGAV